VHGGLSALPTIVDPPETNMAATVRRTGARRHRPRVFTFLQASVPGCKAGIGVHRHGRTPSPGHMCGANGSELRNDGYRPRTVNRAARLCRDWPKTSQAD